MISSQQNASDYNTVVSLFDQLCMMIRDAASPAQSLLTNPFVVVENVRWERGFEAQMMSIINDPCQRLLLDDLVREKMSALDRTFQKFRNPVLSNGFYYYTNVDAERSFSFFR